MRNLLVFISLSALLFTSCGSSVSADKLYGDWKYTRVRNPNKSPVDSVGSHLLDEQKPHILFTTKDSLLIYWDGQVLSRGTFRIEGRNIQYKEILADGKTREFPFYVEDLTDKQLIFSTKGEDGSEVTAVKK